MSVGILEISVLSGESNGSSVEVEPGFSLCVSIWEIKIEGDEADIGMLPEAAPQ